MTILRKLGWLIGTGFGSGYFPIAPATAGSFVAVVIYFFLPWDGQDWEFYLLIGAGFFVGVWATGTLIAIEDKDPRKAVWDEFIGQWITLLLVPKELPWLLAAFFTFRILDVLKPWPVRRLERLPGGLGIMADDVGAGLYGLVILYALRLALERYVF